MYGLVRIKHIIDRFRKPYTYDSRRYNEKLNEQLLKRFEESEINEVVDEF